MTAPAVRIISYEELDSTSAEARRRAEAGETGPLWISAGRQSAGRGRRGRAWESPTGNLAATHLTVTDRPPAEAAQISFVAALAVSDVVRASVNDPDQVKVKSANDVLIGREKVSGILVESGKAPAGGIWLAVGIGLNLAHPPESAERPATAIARHCEGLPPIPADALTQLAESFEAWTRVWGIGGFAAIGAAWTEHAYGLGMACTAQLPNETVSGFAEGLDADGALRLRLADSSVRRITAGDVFFEGA